MTKEYVMQPKDYKLPSGYDVNVDEEYKQMLVKYPTFESIQVGNITMSSKYKENMKGEMEGRKLGLWYHWQATKALSYIDPNVVLPPAPNNPQVSSMLNMRVQLAQTLSRQLNN